MVERVFKSRDKIIGGIAIFKQMFIIKVGGLRSSMTFYWAEMLF